MDFLALPHEWGTAALLGIASGASVASVVLSVRQGYPMKWLYKAMAVGIVGGAMLTTCLPDAGDRHGTAVGLMVCSIVMLGQTLDRKWRTRSKPGPRSPDGVD